MVVVYLWIFLGSYLCDAGRELEGQSMGEAMHETVTLGQSFH